MHVPIGRSGVQAVPKTLHSQGLMTPFSTSPHWHAFGSATRTPGTSNLSAIVAGARDIVQGEEVAAAVGFVRGAAWILSQRGRSDSTRSRFPDDR